MVKLMENTYRDVNIAIANEFSRLAEHFGVNIWEAISIANRHPRVKILSPGPGVGGHCISVDPWFLVEAAPDLSELITAARHVNDTQPQFVMDLIRRMVGGDLSGKRIAALGLAFKADVDDLRESPAVEITTTLAHAGALVSCYEPYKPDVAIAGVTCANSLEGVLQNADGLVLLVGHREFKTLDPQKAREMTPARWAVDTVGAWDRAAWTTAGFQLARLGDGKSNP